MKQISAIALALTIMTPSLVLATETVTETRIALQTALQKILDASLIDGAVKQVDLSNGEVNDYYPVDNHPMIMKLGGIYVLCTDLVSKSGNSVMVDYYLAQKGGSYAVIQTEVDNRDPLKALMEAGRAKRLE